MGDEEKSIVFNPDEDSEQNIFQHDENPDWEQIVADFKAAGNTEKNVIRLDIGYGDVTVKIDEEKPEIHRENGERV